MMNTMNRPTQKFTLTLMTIMLSIASVATAQGRIAKEVHRFKAKEAKQGVAVDENFVYVVGSQQIAKYDKKTHKKVAHWKGPEDGPIQHLDSGVIYKGKIYCSHSNYPGVPMTSSVEIWDAKSLEHVENHNFGIGWGSCTWIDRHDGYWWVGFAQYEKWKHATGKGTEWTTVVKMDDNWRSLEEWVLPNEIVEKMRPMSNSGGSWGPDGLLYLTGHDHEEFYAMQLPSKGSTLELVEIVPIKSFGQGIAWDHGEKGIVYGIRKKERVVIKSKLQPYSSEKNK